MYDLPNLQNCTIAIIGLGYVGLPVATEFAKCKRSFIDEKKLNRKIIGFDINEKRIKDLQKGIDVTNEINSEEINKLENISFTNDPKKLYEAEVFIVTVPTPIDKSKKPNLEFLIKACETIGKVIRKNSSKKIPIIIFESTVYPGATEEVCVPIISSISGISPYVESLKHKSFGFGYSPERINPGDKNHRISSIVKVTSGNNREISEWVNCLYGSIIKAGTYLAQSIKVAEAAKVIENTQRDLNIALINELSIVLKKLNIDTLDVIAAAKTKWNFFPFKPGLVGGHCIGVDPYYLTFKAEQIGYHPQIILAGRRINDSMGVWYVEQLILDMAKKGMQINSSNALILGFTFKENCPDIRNTKVINILEYLNQYSISFDVVDPYADKQEVFHEYKIEIKNKLILNKKYSIVVVAVAHDYFREFEPEKWESLNKDAIILDLKGIVPKYLNPIRP